MARGNVPLHVFNRGRISPLALARTDLDRTRLSAEEQTNFVPRTLGSMMLRPGLEYKGGLRNNSSGIFIPFVFASNDTAAVELTSTAMRVWVNDAVIQRSGVSSTFSNGGFATDLTDWTDGDDAGSTSLWVPGGYLALVGSPFSYARRRQALAVASTDASVEHGIKVVIDRGRVTFLAGSSSGGDDYVSETILRPGEYSFAITPSSNIYVEFKSNTQYASRVDSISVESSGDMVVSTPWASTDLQNVRWDASADVTFVACRGIQQRRIERRATRSWGVAKYEPEDGPFRSVNTSSKRLTPSGLSGNITLTADPGVFNSSHVGSLFQLTSVGQNVEGTFTGGDQWSEAIRVSGVSDTRKFQILVTSLASTVGTVRFQRSIGEEGNWGNIAGASWTSTVDSSHNDGLDNQIAFYRIGMGSTDFTGSSTQTAVASLVYANGGLTGVVRINAVTASSLSSASVLTPMGSTAATSLWAEGDWSGYRGYPTSVALHEGRLFWGGKVKVWGSISDAYGNFDPDTEGDSGPINRSIGSGAVDVVPWLTSLGRLIVGAQSREMQAKTNSLEEPLTPTNFAIRDISNQGSANVQGVRVDKRVLFTQAGGVRIMEIGYDGNSLDYETADRTVLVPEIGEPGITRMAVQRQPDTRVHCVRSDGTVAMLVSEPAENVVAWLDIKSTAASGVVEDSFVLPGSVEDSVYYVVKREINGSTVRYLEKWAMESEARGGSTNKMADSFSSFNSTLGSTTITGATHLIGQTVVAWGSASSGVFLGSTFVVSSDGTISIPSTFATDSTTTYYGLPYDAKFQSAKLAYAAQAGTALTQRKRVNHLGLILADVHAQGLRFGPSTENLDSLPTIEGMSTVSTNAVRQTYDRESIPFPGTYDTDSRIVLVAEAPKPVTVLGAIIQIETKEKI